MSETEMMTNPANAETEKTEETREEQKLNREEIQEKLKEISRRAKEAQEAMSEGCGRFTLETPITAGDHEITELIYDFTALTGMEYTDAMDSDRNANSSAYQRITYRQALSLFAKAAAKQTDHVDMEDVVSRIGVTDAATAVQLATLFFTASTRAGRMRISKK